MGPVACEHADAGLRLCDPLLQALESRAMTELHREIEVPLIRVLGEMEGWGIRVDVDRLKALSREYGSRLEALEQEI